MSKENNKCLNCEEPCIGIFCDYLCKYGYSVRQYRKVLGDKTNE